MFLKKFFSHSLIYGIAPQIPRIAGLFILPITTAHLTTADFGIYGIVMSYIGLLSALSSLGFPIVMVNAMYKYPKKWKIIWKQIHFYLVIWSLFFGFLQFVVLAIFLPPEANENFWLIILYTCLPTVLFNTTASIGAAYYQYAQKPLYLGVVSAIVGIIAILLNLYTIAYLEMGYMGWFLSNFIVAILNFLFYFYPVYFSYQLRPVIFFRKKFLRKHLRIALPTIPHNYSAYLLNTSDRVVMDNLKVNVKNIGEYNLAYMFGNYFDFVGNAVGMAVGPHYINLYSKKNVAADRSVHFITQWLQISFLLAGFITSLWCKELFQILVSNEDLQGAYPLAVVIIMGYVYRPYYWAAVNRLQFVEKTSQLWKISFVAGMLNLALNFIFIPFYGVMAAAVTTFISLMYLGFAGHFLTAFKDQETIKYQSVRWIIIICSATLLVFNLKDLFWGMKFQLSIILLLVYFSYCFFNRARFKEIQI